MKRIVSIILAALTTVSLFGCSQDAEEQILRIEALEAQLAECGEALSDAERAITEQENAFAAEREELNDALLDAEAKLNDWKSKHEQLQSTLSAANQENSQLRRQLYNPSLSTRSNQTFFLKNGSRLSIAYDADAKPNDPHYTLTLCRADGSEAEIYAGGSLTSIAVSPDESKFCLTNFSIEGSSDAFWYDAETETLTEIGKDGLVPNCGASAFAWLDDRYFLFLSQFDHGTLSLGGDVYVYDTEACAYAPLIDCAPRVQITAFLRPTYSDYRPDWDVGSLDYILFQAVIWDETWNEIEFRSFSLPLAELLEMGVNNDTKTFDGEKVY